MKNITKVLTVALLGYGLSVSAQSSESMFMPPPGRQEDAPHTDMTKMVQPQKVKKHILSFGFFSPVNRHLSLSFDKLIGTDMVFTCQLGVIGPGVNTNQVINSENPTGAYGEAGVKFFFTPDYVTEGTTRFNSMQGTYFKPIVVVSSFQTIVPNFFSSNTIPGVIVQQYTGAALMLNIGRQWVLANTISIDVYAGLGYSVNSRNQNELANNYYSYYSLNSMGGLAISAGVNIGTLF